MSLKIPRRRNVAPTGEARRAAVAALAVADVTTLRLSPTDVQQAVRRAQRRHGGREGVVVELAHRMKADERGTALMLDWAGRAVRFVYGPDETQGPRQWRGPAPTHRSE